MRGSPPPNARSNSATVLLGRGFFTASKCRIADIAETPRARRPIRTAKKKRAKMRRGLRPLPNVAQCTHAIVDCRSHCAAQHWSDANNFRVRPIRPVSVAAPCSSMEWFRPISPSIPLKPSRRHNAVMRSYCSAALSMVATSSVRLIWAWRCALPRVAPPTFRMRSA